MTGNPITAGAMIVGLVVVAVIASSTISKRTWKAAGRKANLSPEPNGRIGKPDLSGEIEGRPVRARTIKRKKKGSSSKNSSKVTYTVVEADHAEPTTDGVMIGRKSAGEAAESTDFGSLSVGAEAVGDRFVVVGGGDETLADAVLSNRARNALLSIDDLSYVSVGDPTDTIMKNMPDMSGSFLGSAVEGKMESMLKRKTAGDVSSAAIVTKSVLYDAEELRQQAVAVAAVADAHEEATLAVADA